MPSPTSVNHHRLKPLYREAPTTKWSPIYPKHHRQPRTNTATIKLPLLSTKTTNRHPSPTVDQPPNGRPYTPNTIVSQEQAPPPLSFHYYQRRQPTDTLLQLSTNLAPPLR
ncbi:unnamed protein product [Lactuca virosa]|uniref:Uncharacterized protein n=1 Tax=Lactuca virosa TaxID=75947 RepID=A0AAU9MFL7_9ASTR|nr:unnamed protein product [Lactuca virosa]